MTFAMVGPFAFQRMVEPLRTKGAVIGGAGGTAAVLATRGKEVRLAAGSPLTVTLSAPVTLRVPVR